MSYFARNPHADAADRVWQELVRRVKGEGERQLRELTGFLIAVDCGTATCRGERAYAVADLTGMVGKHRTVSDVLHRMCCAECGAVVASAWLQTGSLLDQRVRPRRVALIGPEARE